MSDLPEPQTFALAPAGTHVTTCIRIVDLGTRVTKFGPKRKVSIVWELSNELMETGKPFTVTQSYTQSMHKESNLRQMLESWRGAKFKEAELVGKDRFQLKSVLGKPALLNVVHSTNGERDFANVAAVSKLVKGTAATQPVNSLIYVWLSAALFDPDAFEQLHEKTQAGIKETPEYRALMAVGNGHDELNPPPPTTSPDFGDEIPF